MNTQEYNAKVTAWRRQMLRVFKANLRTMGVQGKFELIKRAASDKAINNILKRIKDEGVLQDDIKTGKLWKDEGEIIGLGFDLPKHGVYLAKGVGRGHPISNPRKKVDFFDSALDQNINILADIAANYRADLVVDATKIKIKN